jgi:glycerophosphoryl diester phosphodiesterase
LHLPNVPRALLVTKQEDSDNHFLLKNMLLAPFLDFHCLNLHHSMVTEKTMALWNEKKVPVAVWTIQSKEDVQKYLRMGAISVITDVL